MVLFRLVCNVILVDPLVTLFQFVIPKGDILLLIVIKFYDKWILTTLLTTCTFPWRQELKHTSIYTFLWCLTVSSILGVPDSYSFFISASLIASLRGVLSNLSCPAPNWGCNFDSMLGLKLNRVSKRGPSDNIANCFSYEVPFSKLPHSVVVFSVLVIYVLHLLVRSIVAKGWDSQIRTITTFSMHWNWLVGF